MGHLTGNQALPPATDLFVLGGASVSWLLGYHRASLPAACRAFGVNKRLNSSSTTPNPPSLVGPRASERSPGGGLFTFNCFWIESPAEAAEGEKGLGG